MVQYSKDDLVLFDDTSRQQLLEKYHETFLTQHTQPTNAFSNSSLHNYLASSTTHNLSPKRIPIPVTSITIKDEGNNHINSD